MLNLLKESSKKSPFRSKFTSSQEALTRARLADDEARLKGISITVPFTARRLKLVLEDRFFITAGLSVLLYIFSGETGNDWIYMLTALALTTMFLGIVVPLLQVLETDIFFNLPREAVAKERLNLRVRVKRRKWFGPLARIFPVKWLLVKIKLTRLGEKENMLRPIMVEHLAEEAWVVAQTPRLRRGIYNLDSIEIFSCYPFGLAWWVKSYIPSVKFTEEWGNETGTYTSIMAADAARTTAANPQMIVFPRTENIEGNFLFRLRAAGDSALFFSSSRPIAALSSASVRSLREFRSGDSPRLIHWPTSARTGKLMIREFESEGLPGFDLLIDLTSDWQNEEQFELAVSITLSLLQLGYKMGGAPDLFVIPSVDDDIELLPNLLTDLPPIAPGIGWAAQILARVEALKVTDPKYRVQVPRVGETDGMALLTVRPAAHTLPDPENDETGVHPEASPKQVDLWVMSRAYLEADSDRESLGAEDPKTQGPVKAPIPLHALGQGDRRTTPDRTGPRSRPGRVLSSISEYEELSHI
jgi:uncharacterized protein (DUF58 family)